MASADNRGMIFILKGSRTKVDQPDLGVEKHPPLRCLSVDCGRGRGNFPVVGERLIRVVTQQDVFRLEIGVDQVEVVKD